ncbi:MAG: MBL fold metallo-hydrolase [Bacteroidia bacterium]
MTSSLLTWTDKGWYCPEGDFYVDPRKPVARAVISHAHSDHAVRGCQAYLSTPETRDFILHRLGRKKTSVQGLPYGEALKMGNVEVTFFPSGHIRGAAQILICHQGKKTLYTGDIKLAQDPTASLTELQKADVLIIESTFGMPKYRWPPVEKVVEEIITQWHIHQQNHKSLILSTYSLGKAQRLLSLLPRIGPVYVSPTIAAHCRIYESQGVSLGPWKESHQCPDPGALWLVSSPKNYSEALPVSGWVLGKPLTLFGPPGFVLSDHADFEELCQIVFYAGAQKVLVQHGFVHAFASFLQSHGIDAVPIPST